MQTKISFEDYEGFVEKFKPKKTTDDCFTPPEIYDVVLDYVRERWGIEEKDVVRPFWPGGDYQSFEYPEGCCVVDNPPFSILTKIQGYYLAHGIRFFLFAPALTCLSGKDTTMKVDHILCDGDITYANGANVNTAFVTNLEDRYVIESDPDLGDRIREANTARLKQTKRKVGNYEYPDEVLTAARANWLAAHHTPLRIERESACRLPKLDEQVAYGKAIFGGGLLLSTEATGKRAAAERAAAERAAAERAGINAALKKSWTLSDRERAIQAILDRQERRARDEE